MDNCKHIQRVSPASDHSILNPQNWHCGTCGTTESVWACLSCPYVACGRYIAEHAVKHYNDTKHPLAIEVNEKYVYCYECDDYILNDNAAGDIKILRSCLSAIATQSFSDVSRQSHRLLRSYSYAGSLGSRYDDKQLRDEDLCYTALWFRRYYLLAKAFSAWKKETKSLKKSETEKALAESPEKVTVTRKKRPLVPGVTGLRNLGNTCYMNSILQVLSHVMEFRQYFLSLRGGQAAVSTTISPSNSRPSTPPQAHRSQYMRQTTMECFQHINEKPGCSKKGGLNGGSSSNSAKKLLATTLGAAKDKDTEKISLCTELHALLRVMWSGKWALVSPHKMLYAVWSTIPFFKGYTQQDAQEFLCEFLDKVQSELDRIQSQRHLGPVSGSCRSSGSSESPRPSLVPTNSDIIDSLFQGELVSEVTCVTCGGQSTTREPFMDLSLDFPARYHWYKNPYRICVNSCHVEEMLSNFTEVEKLEGKIYACQQCNSKRRQVSTKPPIYTEAEKRFMISKLPAVLRLHLKRFMWGGRNHRGKIMVHVDFDEWLDLSAFSHPDVAAAAAADAGVTAANPCSYRLVGVVMHHGRGFGSGHYTAYCRNDEAGTSSTPTRPRTGHAKTRKCRTHAKGELAVVYM